MTANTPAAAVNQADCRTRFIFDEQPVRGLHVRLQDVWQHIVGRKHYPAAIRKALGELLAAGSLLSSNLKIDGTLIVQVQGQGRLKMLVVKPLPATPAAPPPVGTSRPKLQTTKACAICSATTACLC